METSYESLEDIISGLINVNPNEFSIKMKYLFNSSEVLALFEVVNDESDNPNGVGVDNIHESVFSPHEFKNAHVFSIGADNEDEIEGSKIAKWRVRSTKLNDCESFRVRKYQPKHTCSLDTLHFDHRQASSKLIGHCIKSKIEGTSQSYRPNDIIEDVKKQCGMTCSYNKAWRAREVTLGLARGSPEDSFSILSLYCHILERKNLRTVTFIKTDSVNFVQLDQLLCRYALAAYKLRRISCYDCCSPYYYKETLVATYVGSIYLVGPMYEWDVPDDVQSVVVLPPKRRKPSGSPLKKHRPSEGEEIIHRKCGRCRGLGHNRKKCTSICVMLEVLPQVVYIYKKFCAMLISVLVVSRNVDKIV
ncbi:hypothetical protein Ddye_000343 [Dipteronia dyeriana]|uniref:MuDRA-like transposase n=1 Tax=Dipteronia dyeriana TaxID=168575 RepID=A0AAD9XLJ9_9ROSI|nr:hypothetical protein Ddye_000343 [Dipteronia dyeriana]